MADGKEPELRLGLVLYGGVSLAVYIYGVVVEVQHLLKASARFEGARAEAERAEADGYAKALSKGGLSRVSVDIVSGTSAGGINGILLAKALASGGDVDAVRDIWIKDGDIGRLLRRLADAEPESLLSTDVMEGQLGEGFKALGEGGGSGPDGALDLFVSATHLRGDLRRFRDSLGTEIETLKYRYVFQLKLRPKDGRDDFARPPRADKGTQSNAHLVKLSRATSAFPVAFEPVEITPADDILDPGDEPSAWFADGGILNNKPFTEALQTIFTRSSDRPVRRWLLSVDPDPKSVVRGPPPGLKPAFDQIAVSAVAGIPRYQSIAHDLEELEDHNEAVRSVNALVVDLERELSGLEPLPPERAPTSYRRLRSRAFAEEIADWLMLAAWPDQPRPDSRAIRRAFVDGAYSVLRDAGWEDGASWQERPDLAFELRRAYYLIKLLGMAIEIFEGSGDETRGPDRQGSLRAGLWEAFELIRNSLWRSFSSQPIAPREGAEGGSDLAFGIARARVGQALDDLAAVRDEVVELVTALIEGAAVVLAAPDRSDLSGGEPFEVRLDGVFRGFAYRDSLLLPIEAGGGLRHRDLVEHAQISPAAAKGIDVPAADKLAGDTAGHFGGFLDEGWRKNDLLWGRLDAAEILVGVVMKGSSPGEREAVLEGIREEIVKEEMPEEPWRPDGDWLSYLKGHTIGRADISSLPDQKRLDALKARAGFVLRGMLAKAAKDAKERPDAPQGKLRRRVLVDVDRALTWAGRILFLCVDRLRRRARGSEPPS